MLLATYQDQHRSAGRPDGAARIAAYRARHTCTDQPNSPARQSILRHRANWRAVRRSPSFFRGWAGACDEVAASLRLRAAGLRDEQIAAVVSFDTFADQLPGKVSDPLEFHSSNRLSSLAASDEEQPSEEAFSEVRTAFRGRQIVFVD